MRGTARSLELNAGGRGSELWRYQEVTSGENCQASSVAVPSIARSCYRTWRAAVRSRTRARVAPPCAPQAVRRRARLDRCTGMLDRETMLVACTRTMPLHLTSTSYIYIYLFIHPSIRPSIHPSIYPPIHPTVYLLQGAPSSSHSANPACSSQSAALLRPQGSVQGSRGRPSGLLGLVPGWAAECAPKPATGIACDSPVRA